jgi:phosphatidylglycerophosphate synthase
MSEALGRIGLRLGLSPDFWTYAGIVAAGVASALLALKLLGWVLVVFFVMFVLDMMDGATARAGNLSSKFGEVLDPVADRYAELIIAGGLILSGLIQPIWVLFGISGALMASYVRAKIESTTSLKANVGWAGRSEKTYILMAGIIVEMTGIGPGAMQWALIIMGVLSHITAVQRMAYLRRNASGQ